MCHLGVFVARLSRASGGIRLTLAIKTDMKTVAKQAENSNAKQSGDEGMASAAAAAPATIASATTPATTQGAPADETAAIDSEHDGGLLDDVATTVTSVVKYKAKRKKAQFEVDEEDEANQEDLGDYEGLQYSCDIIITNNDRGFHVCEYFGPSWAKLIVRFQCSHVCVCVFFPSACHDSYWSVADSFRSTT